MSRKVVVALPMKTNLLLELFLFTVLFYRAVVVFSFCFLIAAFGVEDKKLIGSKIVIFMYRARYL